MFDQYGSMTEEGEGVAQEFVTIDPMSYGGDWKTSPTIATSCLQQQPQPTSFDMPFYQEPHYPSGFPVAYSMDEGLPMNLAMTTVEDAPCYDRVAPNWDSSSNPATDWFEQDWCSRESHMEAASSSPEEQTVGTTPKRPPFKAKYECPIRGCNKVFSRNADLERHKGSPNVHPRAGDSGSKPHKTFGCGYSTCRRAGKYINSRKDHCREHLRKFHGQDLGKHGEKALNYEWLMKCTISNNYWYCNSCLARNIIGGVSYAWKCRDCGRECEPERIAIRTGH